MNYFDKLPSELLEYIFKMIDFNDYFNLRLICKRFLGIITNLNIEELLLTENDFNLNNRSDKEIKWHFTNKSINNIYFIKSNLIYKFMDSSLFNFKFLKCLKIDSSIGYEEFDIGQLCKYFFKLEHLELDYIIGDYLLCLPELKFFYLHTIINGSLIIDSPKLEKVSIRFGLDNITINYLDSIKHFETNKLDDNLLGYNNLEYICASRIGNLTANILNQFPKLKSIEFDLEEFVYSYFMDIKSYLNQLLADKIKLKRDNLKIFLKKKLITDSKQLDEYEELDFFNDDTNSSDETASSINYDTDPNCLESDISFDAFDDDDDDIGYY